MVAGFFYLIGRYFHGSVMVTISRRRGLSRKAPSNARGDDPFLGGFFFSFFLPTAGGALATWLHTGLRRHFPFCGGPAFLFCGNLLSLDRGNGCARSFAFPSWLLHPGSRSNRAGPGIGEGDVGMYEARATLSEGGIQPQHISKPG